MAKFKQGDFVRIKAPPSGLTNNSGIIGIVDLDIVGKIGTVVCERYDPLVNLFLNTTHYEVNIFGRLCLAIEPCLELVPGEPDIEHVEEEDELHA